MPSRFCSSVGDFVRDGDVPAADEDRGDRGDVGVEPGLDPALDAAHVGLGGGQVLLGGEEQGDVDRDPGEDRLLDRRQAGLRAGDLDVEVVALALRVELRRLRRSSPRCRRRAAARPRASTKPSTPAVRSWTGRRGRSRRAGRRAPARRRAPRSVSRRTGDLGDLLVVGVAAGDRLVEDRRVGGQPGDRELLDVAGERAVARASCG